MFLFRMFVPLQATGLYIERANTRVDGGSWGGGGGWIVLGKFHGYSVAMQAIHFLPASSYNTIACFVTMESPGEAAFMIRALNNTEVQL